MPIVFICALRSSGGERGEQFLPGDRASFAQASLSQAARGLSRARSSSTAHPVPSPATQRPCFDGIDGGRKRVSATFIVTVLTKMSKTVSDALRGAQPLFHALFGVKTLSGTHWGTAFNELGLRG